MDRFMIIGVMIGTKFGVVRIVIGSGSDAGFRSTC